MQIRPAHEGEIQEVAELWCDSFPGDRTVSDRAAMLRTGGRYGGLETVLVADDAGRPAGACKTLRFDQHVTGVEMPMMGLAAVAVKPSRRKRGVAGRLCTEALLAAASRGDVISALYPFRPAYYRRMGWELVGELHDHRCRTAALPAYTEAARVREARGPEDADAIAASYARAAAAGHGPLVRDRRIWVYRLAGLDLGVRPLDVDEAWDVGAHPTRRALIYEEDDGVARGYALVRYAPARSPEEGVLEVRELVAETESAYRGILGHLRAQADQWPWSRHFARPGERFGDRLDDPRPPRFRPARSLYFPTGRIVRGPMLRVVDVPAAMRLRRWFDGPDTDPATATLRIQIEDGELPENRGPWQLRIEEGAASVGTAADTAGNDDRGYDAALATDAAGFARLFAGGMAPSTAHRLGSARVDGDARLLDRAFSVREPFWLLDEF